MKKLGITLAALVVSGILAVAWGQGITYPQNTSTTLNFGPTQLNVTTAKVHVENAGSGDNDLYTVPANSRAIFIWNDFNSAGTTTTWFQEVKISGVYYRVGSNGTRNTLTNGSSGASIVLNAGETFSINTSQAGMNYFGTAFVFPASSGVMSPRLTSLANGTNTMYTCCSAGRTKATVLLGNSQMLGSGNAGLLIIGNQSGGSLNFSYNLVNSAGSPGTANKVTNDTAVANNAIGSFGATNNWTLVSGDFINVNASGACSPCLAWVNIFEQ